MSHPAFIDLHGWVEVFENGLPTHSSVDNTVNPSTSRQESWCVPGCLLIYGGPYPKCCQTGVSPAVLDQATAPSPMSSKMIVN